MYNDWYSDLLHSPEEDEKGKKKKKPPKDGFSFIRERNRKKAKARCQFNYMDLLATIEKDIPAAPENPCKCFDITDEDLKEAFPEFNVMGNLQSTSADTEVEPIPIELEDVPTTAQPAAEAKSPNPDQPQAVPMQIGSQDSLTPSEAPVYDLLASDDSTTDEYESTPPDFYQSTPPPFVDPWADVAPTTKIRKHTIFPTIPELCSTQRATSIPLPEPAPSTSTAAAPWPVVDPTAISISDDEDDFIPPRTTKPSVPTAKRFRRPNPAPEPVPSTSSAPRPIVEPMNISVSDEDVDEFLNMNIDFQSAFEALSKKDNPNAGTSKSKERRLGLAAPFRPPFDPVPPKEPKKTSTEPESPSIEENPEIAEKLKGIDQELIDIIKNEIMDSGKSVTWDDISGLTYAKTVIQETVVMPQLRPDLFRGIRRPPKGILLFGPPGTGKTMIGKCIASQSKSKFFSISASSLTSKWVGEGEKLVRTLFTVAAAYQPAVIFIDEIDSLLSQRTENEHDSSRRLKTEFLIRLDGATTGEDDRVLIIGATNRPQELDEAARRRLVKRLYIPLPEEKARQDIMNRLLLKVTNDLTEEGLSELAKRSEGYSGADMQALCQEAAMGPIRDISLSDLQHVQETSVRPVNIEDFRNALKRVKATVDQSELEAYVNWDKLFGSGSG